jgi:Domain of unknown function (DUF4185)
LFPTTIFDLAGNTIQPDHISRGDLMLYVVRGKTRKIVQLVGEIDRERGRHPPQTFSKYRLYGTDLGTPLDFGPAHDLWFLFGDAWTATVRLAPPLPPLVEPALYSDKDALKEPYNRYHPFNADPVAVARSTVTAHNLDETFELEFFVAPEPDQSQGYATLEIPGVTLLTNKVPTGAINTSSGVYLFATGKAFLEGADPAGIGGTNVSWVARWSDLTKLRTDPPYLFSWGPFANYLVPVVGGLGDGTGTPGHPTAGAVVWLWGTGFPNRQSSVRLAYVPLSQIGDRQEIVMTGLHLNMRSNAWRFFCKTDTGISWVEDESQATPLFNSCSVGEFSVAWNKYLGLWLMLYQCADPRGVLCRWAANPWGPWSEGIIIFEPWRDNGYRHFMHVPNQDDLSDPGRESDWGGEYAPIIIPRYTLGSGRSTTIRYTMSTWNPYTVLIMESELRLRREGIFTILTRAWENALGRVLGRIRRLAR